MEKGESNNGVGQLDIHVGGEGSRSYLISYTVTIFGWIADLSVKKQFFRKKSFQCVSKDLLNRIQMS